MSDPRRQFDKTVYAQAYKQNFQSSERSRGADRLGTVRPPAPAAPGSDLIPHSYSSQQKSRTYGDVDPRKVDPRTANLDRQLLGPAATTASYPAALAGVPLFVNSTSQRTNRRTKKTAAQSYSPVPSERWMGIFENDDDLEARTMDLRSQATTPLPYTIEVQPPSTQTSLTPPRDQRARYGHEREALPANNFLQAETPRGPRTLDQYYARKQQTRTSSDAPTTLRPSAPHHANGHSVPSSSKVHNTAKPLRHTGQSSHNFHASAPPATRTPREPRPNHVRSSSDQPKPVAAARPRGDQVTSLGHETHDRSRRRPSSDMKPTAALVPLPAPPRRRAALPGQWTVDTGKALSIQPNILDLPEVGPPKQRIHQDTVNALPSVHSIVLPLVAAAQDEDLLRPRRRRHSPPPAREVHRSRPRRSSFDDAQYASTVRERDPSRDGPRTTPSDRHLERRKSSRASRDRARTREYDRDRDKDRDRDRDRDRSGDRSRDKDKELRGQEHRSRRNTTDDHKASLWLRESTFDRSKLPPGDLPLPANYLPPKPPQNQPHSRQAAQKTRAIAETRSRQASSSFPVQPTADAYGLDSARRPAPAKQHYQHGPRHMPQPTPASATARPGHLEAPHIFPGESRWKEDFDAKTLNPSVFSAETSRSRSAPPEDPTPAKGFGRRLRKRPPELPKLTLNAGHTPPPGPLSPPLQSPASGGSDKSRFGSLPRVLVPRRWLGR